MIWFCALYFPALYLLWRIMKWDYKRRTLVTYAVLLAYGCGLAAVGPLAVAYYAFTHTKKPACSCEMVKNHECP